MLSWKQATKEGFLKTAAFPDQRFPTAAQWIDGLKEAVVDNPFQVRAGVNPLYLPQKEISFFSDKRLFNKEAV